MKIVNELKEWLLLVAYVLALIFATKLGGLILEDYKKSIVRKSTAYDLIDKENEIETLELELTQLQLKKMRAEYESLK